MGFNYGLEKKKFDNAWETLRKEYREAGMDEEAINEMYDFDWKAFKAERVYQSHTQEMPTAAFDDDEPSCEGHSPLFMRWLEAITTLPDEAVRSGPNSWLDKIDSSRLLNGLQRLNAKDLELLTLNVYEERTATEIAIMQGVSRPTVSIKLKRIKNFLKNF